jgi:molybdate transport system ATP-binding protein
MHLYFREDQPCLKIVASGLFDTMGLFRSCSEEQNELALEWMKLLEIDYLKDHSFLKISGGEQRLVLLARTMVKNPDLLILDEPLHGLDFYHKSLARRVIDRYSEQEGKSLIYVTHREDEIPESVDHVFVLKR